VPGSLGPLRPRSGGWRGRDGIWHAVLARLRFTGAASGLLALAAIGATAQAPFAVTPGFDATTWIAQNTPIELRLNQPLPPATGRLAVLIGVTDLTALFTVMQDRLVYQPMLLPLPEGESEVITYLVSPTDDWREVGRSPLRVKAADRFELAEFGIKVGAGVRGQAAEGHSSPDDAPLRAQYQDLTFNIHEHSAHVTKEWSLRSQGNFLAATYRPNTLRYAQLGDGAPYLDLSDYLVEGVRGRANLSVGHVGFTGNPLLLGSFASRGVIVADSAGPARIAVAAMNGSSIVGWNNPFGVSHSDHRVLDAELGIEAVPSRPGALGMTLSLLDASQLPIAGVSQGVLADAEQSRGAGLQVSASDAAQRVRLDVGYARSRFTNPYDPTLSQGLNLVPLERTTRDARYANVSVDVLRSLAVLQTSPATLFATYRHERVAPLYRSVTTPLRADFLQNAIDFTAAWDAASAQLSHSRSNDNLDDIPLLLKTLTRVTDANLLMPLASLFRAPESPWLPAIRYGFNQIHQFGAQRPLGGSFSPSDVPDQVSANHSLGAQWNGSRWHAGYQYGRSSQDNRQVGFEVADFSTFTHALSLGAMPAASIDVAIDFALEAARNEEVSQELRTRRLSGLANWRFTRTTALSAIVTATRTADDPRTIEQSNSDARLELSQRISLPLLYEAHRLSGQLFVRYTRQGGSLLTPGVTVNTPKPKWVFNTGVALRVL
jgi:hypothetical protein